MIFCQIFHIHYDLVYNRRKRRDSRRQVKIQTVPRENVLSAPGQKVTPRLIVAGVTGSNSVGDNRQRRFLALEAGPRWRGFHMANYPSYSVIDPSPLGRDAGGIGDPRHGASVPAVADFNERLYTAGNSRAPAWVDECNVLEQDRTGRITDKNTGAVHPTFHDRAGKIHSNV